MKGLNKPETGTPRTGKTGRNIIISVSRDLQEWALPTFVKAEEAEELVVALKAIREARGNLELLAKLLDELDERIQTKTSFRGGAELADLLLIVDLPGVLRS